MNNISDSNILNYNNNKRMFTQKKKSKNMLRVQGNCNGKIATANYKDDIKTSDLA